MERALLTSLLAEGLSINAIAARVSRSPSTVSYWLKRHDLLANGAERYGHRFAVDRSTLVRLIDEGKSVPEIAARLDRTTGVIRRALARHGLETRGSQNRRLARQALDAGARTATLLCRHHGAAEHVLEGRGSYR